MMTDLFRGYLVAYIFWVGVSVGSLGFLMIHQLTGGKWGLFLGRALRAGASTIWLMALLAVPILIGAKQIYPWADPSHHWEGEAARLMHEKAHYLNPTFFGVRTVVFFAVMLGLAAAMVRWSAPGASPQQRARAQALAGPGVLLLFILGTFVAFDWTMSLQPLWGSTIWGLYAIIGWGLAAMSFAVLASAPRLGMGMEHAHLATLDPAHPNTPSPTAQNLQDMGNLLFMLINVYAYLAFSQFLIIWSGNLPEEIEWYHARVQGAWVYVPIVLVAGHWLLPFFVLLNRRAKRAWRVLFAVAVALLVLRVLDLCWIILPAFEAPEATGDHGLTAMTWVLALGCTVLVGAVWIVLYRFMLSREPIGAAATGGEGAAHA